MIQDPLWEASFPDVAGVTVPVGDPAGSRAVGVRLSRNEATERRVENEARAAALRDDFRGLGVDTVSIASAEAGEVDAAFAAWAARRRRVRRAWMRP